MILAGTGEVAEHRPLLPLLSLSVPIALLAMMASLAGLLSDATYAKETVSWAAQSMGQDVANSSLTRHY